MYGLDIAGKLRGHGLLTSEGTLYPLLARLLRGGHVDTSWRESGQGAPRKYYSLTPAGKEALLTFVDAWGVFSHSVSDILKPVGGHDS